MTSSLAFRGASSSALSTHQWTHDVFLNFRSVDTRKNFIAHLYDALDRREIKTFLAFEPLERGNENLSSLLSAIPRSRISIVVLSQNYASSRLCLYELVKILECKETKGQLIVPVFYKVDPSDVRHLKGSFEDAFAKYDKMFEQRWVKEWKTALTQVSNLSGWHLDNNSNEAQVIDEIVQSIASHTNFQVAKHLIKHPGGIESPVQVPKLSNSPSPVGIESNVQEPHLSSSPSPLGIESLVQERHMSSLPSRNSEQESNSSISSYIPFLFLIGSMIGLLQLHDLFKTHPANMWISEAALVIFCLSHAAKKTINETHPARYSQIVDSFRVLSGTLVAVSLSSISLPHQLWWLLFTVWALLAFIVAGPLFKVLCTWIYVGVTKIAARCFA